MSHSISVLGGGAWGTALAAVLARRGERVTLAVRRPGRAVALAESHENVDYLPGVPLPAELAISADWSRAIQADIVVVAIPSEHVRSALAQIATSVRSDSIVVSATKGIEQSSLLTVTALLEQLLPRGVRFASLSGPGFAAEVARDAPVALVAASRDPETAAAVQSLLASPRMRIYSSDDVAGVELCGAVKNVIAIAAGISDGLGLGSSARAAVITRGLAEIMRLVEACGGRRQTAAGLSGLGDLVLTCTGELSRNRAAGLGLARGSVVREHEDAGPVAEGIVNALSVSALAEKHRVEMPIVAAVRRALYEGESPEAMVEQLLNRALKTEF